MKNQNLKIIVFNLNWLGDILFSTPALKALKDHYPNSHIACIVPPTYKDLLKHQPFVDEIIPLSDKTLWGKYQLLRFLKKRSWDIGFLFHRSKSRALLFKWAGVRERIGYDLKKRGHLLTQPIFFPKQELHKMDMLNQLIMGYGINPVSQQYQYHISTQELRLPKPYVVFHPGANWEPKRWPTHHYAKLGNELHSKFNLNIVVTGSSSDQILSRNIKQNMSCNLTDLTGKTSLSELANIFYQAKYIIAGDTGPMHLASACGAKVVALYGPTSPKLNGPRGNGNTKVIWENPGCKTYPCHNPSCKHTVCLENLMPEKVLSTIKEWNVLL